jgi:8-amino-7-oxononanoate synthase
MHFLLQKLEEVKEKNLFREAKIKQNLKYDYSSNDYLSLLNSIRARFWLFYAVTFHGKSACASKYLGGYSKIHQKLEKTVAKHYNCEKSLIFGSGYLASIGILQGICDANTIIFIDRNIHASWIDGIMATKSKFVRFEHNDLNNLKAKLQEYLLQKHNFRSIILTETVFSMDGTVINMHEYIDIAREFGSFLITDNAHGLGVVHNDSNYHLHIHMGTFSKSCAGFGGYVAGNETVIEAIANFGRTQIYSTALPEYLLAYNLFAFKFVCKNTGKMLKKSEKIAQKLKFEYKGSAILIKKFESVDEAEKFNDELKKLQILAFVVRPPTVKKPIIRLCIR